MKPNFTQTQTFIHLSNGFAAECMEGARYQFLAKMAEQQGYTHIKTLCKVIAKNDMEHARRLYDVLLQYAGETKVKVPVQYTFPYFKGNMVEWLSHSIENERFEAEKMYPDAAKIAKTEGYADIAAIFLMTAEVERCHMGVAQQLYEGLKKGTLYKSAISIKWKCDLCGYEAEGKEAWKECPLCLAKQTAVQVPVDVGKTLPVKPK